MADRYEAARERELARATEDARALDRIRRLVSAHGEALDSEAVVDRVLRLVAGHRLSLAHLGATEREQLRAVGSSDDIEPLARRIEAKLASDYREHSAALSHVWAILHGEEPREAPRTWPLDKPVSEVVARAREVAGRARAMEALGELPKGWRRSDVSAGGRMTVSWEHGDRSVEMMVRDGEVVVDSIEAHPHVTISELVAILAIEARREVLS